MFKITAIPVTTGRKQLLNRLINARFSQIFVFLYRDSYYRSRRYLAEGIVFIVRKGTRCALIVRRYKHELKRGGVLPYIFWTGRFERVLGLVSKSRSESSKFGHLILSNFVKRSPNRRESRSLKEVFSCISLEKDTAEFVLTRVKPTYYPVRRRKYDPWKDPNQLRLFPGL